jgi:hypothetical protein
MQEINQNFLVLTLTIVETVRHIDPTLPSDKNGQHQREEQKERRKGEENLIKVGTQVNLIEGLVA